MLVWEANPGGSGESCWTYWVMVCEPLLRLRKYVRIGFRYFSMLRTWTVWTCVSKTGEDEAFVLKRDNIDFECVLPRGGKLWGRWGRTQKLFDWFLRFLVILHFASSCATSPAVDQIITENAQNQYTESMERSRGVLTGAHVSVAKQVIWFADRGSFFLSSKRIVFVAGDPDLELRGPFAWPMSLFSCQRGKHRVRHNKSTKDKSCRQDFRSFAIPLQMLRQHIKRYQVQSIDKGIQYMYIIYRIKCTNI